MEHRKSSHRRSGGEDPAPRADLHTHTRFSDGTLAPEALLKKAKARGLQVVSVTDHDTVDGWAATQDAAQKHDIEVVSGVELSVTVDGREVHLLGYGFDPAHAGLRKHLAEFAEARRRRAEAMVERLCALGLPLTMDEVIPEGEVTPALGRPHVARALVRRGHVASHDAAFDEYIGREGPAFVEKPDVPASDALALLHNAGGIGVLAHPGHWTRTATIRTLVQAGLDGIEVIHPSHDEALQSYYRRIARSYDLLPTGGSDYHGPSDRDEDTLGQFGLSRSAWARVRARLRRNG